jgi:hypothetical protein
LHGSEENILAVALPIRQGRNPLSALVTVDAKNNHCSVALARKRLSRLW